MFSFGADPQVIFYLREKSLEIYYLGSKKSYSKLDFPPEMVSNLEVSDKEKFRELLTGWISKELGGKKRGVVVLSDKVLFIKSVTTLDPQKLVSETETFLGEVPFDPGKVAHVKLTQGQKTYLVAANKELWELIVSALESLGWKITGVLPLSAFGIQSGEGNLAVEEAEKISQESREIQEGNFLLDKESGGEEVKQSSGLKGWVVVTFVLLLLLGGGGIFVFSSRTINNLLPGKGKPQASLPQNVPSTVPVESSSPAVLTKKINKEDLQVEILNGSGIAGQALKVKDLLEGIGFQKVEAGNSEEKVSATEVIFSSRVSSRIKDEVLEELGKMLNKVSTSSAQIKDDLDIQIITGPYSQP
ncbi:MAG: LytR C-terminal domain-containing protein [bacterium]|nr:LytR C-terminal domain-containing protein [bacterium]